MSNNIKITIDGVDRSDIISWDRLRQSIRVDQKIDSSPNVCDFVYQNKNDATFTPEVGDEVYIEVDGQYNFGGNINKVSKKVIGTDRIYEVECKGWMDDFNRQLVDESFENQTVGFIVENIINNHTTGYDTTNISCDVNVSSIEFNKETVTNCIREVIPSGYFWTIDAGKNVYLQEKGDILSDFNITDDSGTLIFNTLTVEEDMEGVINKVYIDSEWITDYSKEDTDSINEYGLYESVERAHNIENTAQAEEKADKILENHSTPKLEAQFETEETGLMAGETITVNSDILDINTDFLIKEISFRMDSPETFRSTVYLYEVESPGLVEYFEETIESPTPHTPETFGNREFNADLKIKGVSDTVVEWDSGTVNLSSGESLTVSSGQKSVGDAMEVCYIEEGDSPVPLQFSTSFSDGVGTSRLPIGYVKQGSGDKYAQFIPIDFHGGASFDGQENIVARSIAGNQLIMNTITATELIETENLITQTAQIGNAVITEAHIDSLSATDVTTGTLSGIEIIGNTIKTSESGARVEIDDNNDEIKIYDTEEDLRLKMHTFGLFFQGPNEAGAADIYSGIADAIIINNNDSNNLFVVKNDEIGFGTRDLDVRNGKMRLPTGTNQYES